MNAVDNHLSVQDVRESIAVARSHGEKFFEQIIWQIENEVWHMLGHASWDSMRAVEYGDMGVVVPRADRPELVSRMRAKGHTQQVIADTLGVGVGTVNRDLNDFPNGNSLESIIDSRGQERPATYKRTETTKEEVTEELDGMSVNTRTGEIVDVPPAGLDGKEYKRPAPSAPSAPVLAGTAAEQHNADSNCEVTGKALITFDAYTYPSHRARMLDTWWPMGRNNIQPMHAALFNSTDVRRIAAGLYALADEMEAHNEYN